MPSNEMMTIIGVIIGLFGAGFTLTLWAVHKMDTDIKMICTRLDAQGQRLDAQGARIDQLYMMFIDLIKHKE